MNNEQWKIIEGFEDYEVSSLGRVRRRTDGYRTYKGRVLSPWEQSWGYLQVTLNGKHKRVHILVLDAFSGERPKGFNGNHKDGNKKNNRLENLEWVSPRENMLHSYRTGLHPKKTGDNHPMSRLSLPDVVEIRTRLKNKTRGDITKIAKEFGVNKTTISRVGLMKTWRTDAA